MKEVVQEEDKGVTAVREKDSMASEGTINVEEALLLL